MPDPLRQTVSASQAAGLVGASKYVTPFMLYHALKGVDSEKDGDNRMNAGNRLEEAIIRWAADDLKLAKLNINREASGDQTYFRRNLLGCHRDADIFDPAKGTGALETKCVFDWRVWKDEWGGGETPPIMHEIQLQTQMYVGDGTKPYGWGVITAYMGGEIFHFPRTPEPELWAELEKAAANLFEDIKIGNEPDPLALAIELPLINRLYPPIIGKVLDLSVIEQGSTDPEVIAENKRRVDFLTHARAKSFHEEQRLFHSKAEEAAKTKLRALALDNALVKLPFGAEVKVKTSGRAGYTVKPSTSTSVTIYVPDNLPSAVDVGGEEVTI